jgi:hypothetical protein
MPPCACALARFGRPWRRFEQALTNPIQGQTVRSTLRSARLALGPCLLALGDTMAIRRQREPQMNDPERAAVKLSEAAFLERCR